MTKSISGRKRVFTFYVSVTPLSLRATTDQPRGNWRLTTEERDTSWLPCAAQAHLPSAGTTHNGLGPLTISNQENGPDRPTGQFDAGNSSTEVPFLEVCKAHNQDSHHSTKILKKNPCKPFGIQEHTKSKHAPWPICLHPKHVSRSVQSRQIDRC